MATVAQRVNEMKFALKQMGVPSEVTDHLDLHAHADPELSSKENVENFLDSHALEQYRLKGRDLRELRSLEEEAQEEGIDSEVQRRLDERVREIEKEIRAEGCADCNAQLRDLRAELEKRAKVNVVVVTRKQAKRAAKMYHREHSFKARKRGSKVVAKTATAKQKAARARFAAAAAQAKREGAKGKNYAKRVGQILAGTGGRAARAASTGAKRTYRRAKSGLTSMSVGDGMATAAFGGGVLRAGKHAWENAQFYRGGSAGPIAGAVGIGRSPDGRWFLDKHALRNVVEPLLNGAIDATYIQAARKSQFTAPVVKGFLNWRPLQPGSHLPKVTVGTGIDGLPSAAGWGLSAKSLMTDAFYGRNQVIKLDNNMRPTFNRTVVIQKYAPPLVGGAASKVVHAVRTSGAAPSPVKRFMAVRVLGS